MISQRNNNKSHNKVAPLKTNVHLQNTKAQEKEGNIQVKIIKSNNLRQERVVVVIEELEEAEVGLVFNHLLIKVKNNKKERNLLISKTIVMCIRIVINMGFKILLIMKIYPGTINQNNPKNIQI